jgi:hypothetical protein
MVRMLVWRRSELNPTNLLLRFFEGWLRLLPAEWLEREV